MKRWLRRNWIVPVMLAFGTFETFVAVNDNYLWTRLSSAFLAGMAFTMVAADFVIWQWRELALETQERMREMIPTYQEIERVHIEQMMRDAIQTAIEDIRKTGDLPDTIKIEVSLGQAGTPGKTRMN